MRLLLDTNVFLWALADSRKLGARALDALNDPSAEVWVSPLSFVEIAIKAGQKKLPAPTAFLADIEAGLDRATAALQANVLPFSAAHAACLARLPFLHRDPFDRGLIAQALVEKLILVSSDSEFSNYESCGLKALPA